jgi:hypothetical protein
MISSVEIQNRLADVLARVSSLDDFEDWFVQQSWNVHKSQDFDLQRLVYAVELRLSEHSSGHLSEEDLREELRGVLQRVPVKIGVPSEAVIIKSGTSSSSSFRPVPRIQPVDMLRVKAFV